MEISEREAFDQIVVRLHKLRGWVVSAKVKEDLNKQGEMIFASLLPES